MYILKTVALLSRPHLRDQPIAVSHYANANITPDAKISADIASCSHAARAKGVKNGMWMKQALKLCPELYCVVRSNLTFAS